MSVLTMPRALIAIATFVSLASAQTCYFPDKLTVSTDIPCPSNGGGAASSCCPADSFCMSNGLCFASGILSRGTCTDQTWNSADCARVCRDINTTGKVSLTPCSGNSYTCGLNTTNCQTGRNIFALQRASELLLRDTDVTSLVEKANTTTTAAQEHTETQTCFLNGQRAYGSSTVLAVGLGMGFPLAIALISCLVMFQKLRARKAKSETMYDPPDEPPVPMVTRSLSSRPSLSSVGRSPTIHTNHSSHTITEPAAMPRSFLDRYTVKDEAKEKADVHEIDMGNPRYELGPSGDRHHSQTPELRGDSPSPGWNRAKDPPGR